MICGCGVCLIWWCGFLVRVLVVGVVGWFWLILMALLASAVIGVRCWVVGSCLLFR